jgi:ArsR family transcriptional regulator, arsenate/arsenite/antimonite-responsive transcriptional repressor
MVCLMRSADIFRAFADEDRLRILNLLLSETEGVCVCEIVDALRLPQYEVSRQLGLLRESGLVAGEKRRTWVYYSIFQDAPPLAAAVLEVVRTQFDEEIFRNDRARLRLRLEVRTDGVCTVGYPAGAPYRDVILVEDVVRREQR